MSKESEKNYRFAEKNRWRLWAWRQIKKRLWERGVVTKHAKGIYFAAKADKDRDIACRKNGFRPENLIAIERDPETVKNLRKKRVVVFEGDVWHILQSMEEKYLDFLNLDFCSGFTNKLQANLENTFSTSTCLIKPGFPVCVNLLRGRDPSDFLSHIKDEYISNKDYEFCFGDTVHRGFLFMAKIAVLGQLSMKEWTGEYKTEEQRWSELEFMKPEFYSYRSGNTFMDSVAFNMPLAMPHVLSSFSPEELNRMGLHKGLLDPSSFETAKKIQNKLSAVKAIRTQRIKGQLPPCPLR